MRSIKLNPRTVRLGLVLLCAGLLLGGCGLAGGHGSIAAGNQYQASGKYRAAYIEAKKVLQNDNKNADAWLLLGKASLMMGNPKTALTDLGKAKANGAAKANWAVPMGQALLVTRQYKKLLHTLPADNHFKPKVAARVHVLRGNALRGLEQNDKARQAYQAALKLNPTDSRALVGLAKLAAAANDTDSATHYLQQALAAAPESPQAWVAKGDLAFNGHDFPEAEADYQKALDFKHSDWLPQEHFYTLARLTNVQAQQNQFDKALANIKTLVKMSPQQPYPQYLHAVVLYKQGHLDKAVSQLQQVLKVAPDNVKAQLLMGAVNYAKGNFSQAQMYLSNVMGMDSKNVPARKMLALTFYREGNSRQALDTLRPIVKGSPSDTKLLAMLQKVVASGAGMPHAKKSAGHPHASEFTPVGKALASGNNAEAIHLLQSIPKGNASTEARRNSLLVMSYLREKQMAKALKVAAEYAAKNPKQSTAHLLYGTALVASNKRSKARSQYSEAVKLDPKDLAAILSLGSLDVLEGHDTDATARYRKVLKQDPDNAAAMSALGQLAVRHGHNAEAIKWYNKAISAEPHATAAYIGLVKLYSHSGKFDTAVNTARRLVKAVPKDPMALNALGATELNAGHHDKALESLQHAVKLAPKVPLYRINLARAQIIDKKTKDAASNLDAVIKADPTQVTAVALRAFLKLQQHDLPGALALVKTLQQHPSTKLAGLTLEGNLYMASKSWHKAAQAYQQGLNLHYSRPLVVKSFDALAAAKNDKAPAVLNDWLSKHPKDAATRLLLGQYYLGQAHNTQAAKQYKRVLKAYPSNVAALNNLAWIYTEQHNPDALTLAGKAHKLAPKSPGIADTYAWALLANNQPRVALPILEQAVKAAPKAPTIQYHLAVAQSRTGDVAGAKATLTALRKSGADFQGKQAADKLYRKLGGTTGGHGK